MTTPDDTQQILDRLYLSAERTARERRGEVVAPEPPAGEIAEEDGGGGLLNALLAPFELLAKPARKLGGFLEAEAQAVQEVSAERGETAAQGLITGLTRPLGLASLLDPEIRQRRQKLLSEAGGAYQFFDNLKSSFPGEKLLLETLADPLNIPLSLPPLGVARTFLRARRAAGATRGLPLAERARAVRAALPELVPMVGKESLAQLPRTADIEAEGFTMNMARRMANEVRVAGTGKVPLLVKPLQFLNPSAFLDAARVEDQATIKLITRRHLQEYGDNVITRDIAPVRALEERGVFSPFTKEDNSYLRVTSKETKEVRDVPLGDVLERFGRYQLTPEQLRLINGADEAIDAYRDMMVREGADVGEIFFAPGEHYFNRIVTAIRDVVNKRSPTGGRMVGAKPSFTRTRLHDLVEESIQNGTHYFGPGSRTPISDMVETYMRGAMKVVIDQRLANAMKPLRSTLRDRIPQEFTRRAVQAKNRVRLGGHAVRNLQDAFVGKRLAGAEFGSVHRFSPELGERLHEVLQIVDEAERSRELLSLRNTAGDMLELARLEAREAAAVRHSVAEAVARPLGLRGIPQPAFSGSLFPQEVVERVMAEIDPQVNTMLRNVGEIGNLMRSTQLTVDTGFVLVQGLMVATRSPVTWVRAAKESFHALLDPRVQRSFIARPDTQEALAFFGGRIHLGSNEFTEAMAQGVGRRPGLLLRAARAFPGGEALFRQTFGRFQAAFDVYFDVARVKMAQAFRPMVEAGRATKDDVAQFVNKMTGVTSTRALGVSSTQAELESTLAFLAPRYTRATGALVVDAFQGGFRGAEARRAWLQFFGGTLLAYYGIAAALGQKPKLDPRDKKDGGDGGEFMTVEIGGQHIGLGSKPYSIARTLVKMGADPEHAPMHLAHWWRGSSAPVTGAAWDIASGRTYIGELVGWNLDGLRQIGGRFLPFWLEAVVNDTPRPGAAGVAAEFSGLRSWPIQFAEQRDTVRDDLASFLPREQLTPDQVREMGRQGLETPTWDILSVSQKRRIEKGVTDIPEIDERREELALWSEKTKKVSKEMGEPAQNAFYQDQDAVRTQWELEAKRFEKAVLEGRETPEWFRAKMSDLNIATSALNQQIYDPNGRHAEVHALFAERRLEREFVPQGDIARGEYIAQLVASSDLEDKDGNYLFQEADQRKRQLEHRYGATLIREVESSFLEGKETPLLWRLWVQDRERLRRYWQITDDYLRRHPQARILSDALRRAETQRKLGLAQRLKNHTQLRRMRREIGARKEQLRRQNPDIDSLLLFWGPATRPLSDEAERRLGQRWDEVR